MHQPLARLLTRGEVVSMCCDQKPPRNPDSELLDPWLACAFLVPDRGIRRRVQTRRELAQATAPITNEAQALGIVALLYPQVQIPLYSDELRRLANLATKYQWRNFPGREAAQIERRPWGFVVRAPEFPVEDLVNPTDCAEPHLWRQAFAVSQEGFVCRLNEAPVALAYAERSNCAG